MTPDELLSATYIATKLIRENHPDLTEALIDDAISRAYITSATAAEWETATRMLLALRRSRTTTKRVSFPALSTTPERKRRGGRKLAPVPFSNGRLDAPFPKVETAESILYGRGRRAPKERSRFHQ